MIQDKVSVFIADGQYLTRYALKRLVLSKPHLHWLGEAKNEDELLEFVGKQSPQILMIDYYEEGFALSSIKRVKEISPTTKIIIVSADDTKRNIFSTIEWGINAFLTKSCDEEEISDALKATINDDKYFCSKVLNYLIERSVSGRPTKTLTPLTSREIEVVQLIAKGLVAKEIGALLNLSPHTVYTHRKKIMHKLELKSSSELVLYAMNAGLVAND